MYEANSSRLCLETVTDRRTGQISAAVLSEVVTYLYVKRDKGHVTCSVYCH